MSPDSDNPLAWMRKVEEHLAASSRCLDAEPVLPDITAFHCQQAVEKALKALLLARGASFRRTHNLAELVNELEAVGETSPDIQDVAEHLTPFAQLARYPQQVEETTVEEARRVVDEVRGRLEQ